MSKWIPVSEELPEDAIPVMVTLVGWGKPVVAEHNSARKIWDGFYNRYLDQEVLAWMPLPEPYKETVR